MKNKIPHLAEKNPTLYILLIVLSVVIIDPQNLLQLFVPKQTNSITHSTPALGPHDLIDTSLVKHDVYLYFLSQLKEALHVHKTKFFIEESEHSGIYKITIYNETYNLSNMEQTLKEHFTVVNRYIDKDGRLHLQPLSENNIPEHYNKNTILYVRLAPQR